MSPSNARGLVLALGLVLLALPVRADIIVTTSGGRIVGKIIEERENDIRVRTEKGPVITIPRDEIDSITREKLEDLFARRAKKVKDDDAKGLLELGNWARDLGLPVQAAECWEKVLKLEPGNGDARVALGYTKVDGKWLRGDELKKANGFVEHEGRWVTPEEKQYLDLGLVKRGERWVTREDAEAIDAGRTPSSAPEPVRAEPAKPVDRGEKPDARKLEPKPAPKPPKPEPDKPAPPIDLPADEKELLKLVAPGKPEAQRLEALRALCAKGDVQTLAARQEVVRLIELEKKSLLDHVKQQKSSIRGRMAGLVVERRKAALAFIFDKVRYPDEDHGRVGQPEVDRLVDLLRRAWQDPLRELLADKSDKRLVASWDEIKRLASWLRDPCGGSFDEAGAEDELSKAADAIVTTSKLGVDVQDLQIVERSLQVLKYNETVKSSISPEERACILVTNEYRMMFGMPALKVHEPLVQAARKHSKDMVDHNFFAHDSPTNGSPAQRCAREGAKYTGENIAMGHTGGRETFHQWYTSSGHHRNVLARHRAIGIGCSQNYWTQDFGADDPQ